MAKGANHHELSEPLVPAVKSVVEIKGDGAVFHFLNLMPYPNGSHHRVGFAHQFLVALQDDQTA